MSLRTFIATLTGAALLAAFVFLTPEHRRQSVRSYIANYTKGSATLGGSSQGPTASAAPKADLKTVQELFKKESAKVGQVDPDPEGTRKRLKAFAENLGDEGILWLESQASDRALGGDERFLAAYLLSENGSVRALGSLRQIALSAVPKLQNQALVELERQIRAIAIEGLSKVKDPKARDALLDVIQVQQDDFLSDRAHRALYAWESGKPVEEQDKEGMKKLLYNKKGR